MGVRIHKILGYGLVDVKTENYTLSDNRFRDNFLDDIFDNEYKYSEKSYLEFLENKLKEYKKNPSKFDFREFDITLEIGFIKRKNEEGKLSSLQTRNPVYSFNFQPEFGLDNVFSVIPYLENDKWYRYDDMIDYVEETEIINSKDCPCKNKITVFNNGIFPYSGIFWDNRTGKRIEEGSSMIDFLQAKNVLSYSREKKQVDYYLATKKIAIKELGFENQDDVLKYITPMVPWCLRFLVEFLNIFKDHEKTIRQFKPMLYTWWG